MPTKKTEETAAAKSARARKTAVPEPEPVVEAAPAPRSDRTMFWALGVLGAALVFGGGYLVGHAVGDDGGVEIAGRGTIAVSSDQFPMGPMGGAQHLPGMVPFEIYPMPHMYPMPHLNPHDNYPAPDQSGGQAEVEGGGYLGISGVDTPGAVMVVEVVPGSPADQAGIVAGDRIISFGGTSIESMEQLADLVHGTEPGTVVEVVVGGPGGGHTVSVTVGDRSRN